MRIAMYYNNRDLRLEEMPRPEIGPGEVLLKVIASGICGSDVMEWYRISKAPLVLGHEVAGEIVEVGAGVDRYRVGDRVAASHHVPCNTCAHCLRGHHTSCDTLRATTFDPGGFAEYLRLPAINVDRGIYPIPEGVSFEDASFAEPLACALRGQKRAGLQPGDCVCVIGCGIIGLLHIKLAAALGAGKIVATDLLESRLEAASACGAHRTLRVGSGEDLPTAIREINGGRLADQVIVCAGAPDAIEGSFSCAERGGCIMLFAPTDPGVTVPLNVNEVLWANDISITSSYAGSQADHLDALALIGCGRVKVNEMITHRLGLAEIGRGFELVAAGTESIKVIIEPQR